MPSRWQQNPFSVPVHQVHPFPVLLVALTPDVPLELRLNIPLAIPEVLQVYRPVRTSGDRTSLFDFRDFITQASLITQEIGVAHHPVMLGHDTLPVGPRRFARPEKYQQGGQHYCDVFFTDHAL